jgi:hypothetical protein
MFQVRSLIRVVRFRVLALAVAMTAGVVATAGCYERVVGVKGPGADAYDVYQPSLKTKNEAIKKKASAAPNKTVPTKYADE